MAVYDGTEPFTDDSVTGLKLDSTVLWHGTSLPVGSANKVPQYGIFKLLDSLTAPTTQTTYIQTSATLSSPNFVALPEAVSVNLFGDGSDGDVTISSDTDLGASNFKEYNDLTIDSTYTLSGNSGMIIKVKGTLTLNGNISVNGKGGAGGTGYDNAGDGGTGGGMLLVIANTITGTGTISANGTDGTNGSTGTTNGYGNDGTVGLNDNGDLTAPTAGGGGDNGSNGVAAGGGGGAGYGDGGRSEAGAASVGQVGNKDVNVVQNTYGSGGGGGESDQDGVGTAGQRVGGGGGGGGGYLVVITNGDLPACTISADGGNGGNKVGSDWLAFGGGGGGGGHVFYTFTGTNSATITADGGTKGNGAGSIDNGDDGLVIRRNLL